LECHYTFGRYPYIATTCSDLPASSSRRAGCRPDSSTLPSACDGSDNRAEYCPSAHESPCSLVCANAGAIGAFYTLRSRIDSVTLPIGGNGFDVQYKIVVACTAHDQLDFRSPRYRELSVTAENVLGNSAIVDAAIA